MSFKIATFVAFFDNFLMISNDDLGTAPIRPLFFRYYGPALIGMVSSTTHQIINGVILGHYVGKDGLAAVGLFGPVLIVLIAFASPVMIGGSVLIGKSFGAKEYDNAQHIFQFATSLMIAFGGTAALISPLITHSLATFLAGNENQDLIHNTSDYTFWQLLSMPFFFLWMIWGNFIRVDHAPKVSRNAAIFAALVNVLLDFFFIIGLNMGVEGASIATALAFVAGALYCLVYIMRGKSHYDISQFKFTLQYDQWKEFFKIGFPTLVSELSLSTGMLLINQKLIPFGPVAVSAFGLVNYLSFILIRPFMAAMIASIPIIAYNLGAKKQERVLDMLQFSLGFTVILGIAITLSGFIFAKPLIQLFSGNPTNEFLEIATHGMSLYFLLFLVVGPNYILSSYLQSTGNSTLSILMNLFKGLVFVMILLEIIPQQFGLSGIWLSRSLAEISTLVIIGIFILVNRNTYFKKMT